MAQGSHPDMPVPLRLYLLGTFRLERASQSIRLPTRKTESLLAYLALSPKEAAHSREKLAALLWGDSPDALARSSLRRALVILRRALGDDLLLADRETVQINPAYPLWVDAIEFQAQAERWSRDPNREPSDLDVAIYQDDLLVNYYDEWIPPLRERFRSLFVESLLKLAEHARRNGEYERTVHLARTILQRDAANESAHQHLMFCYWTMGDRRAALTQFQECKRILKQELDVEPSAETTALYHKIREQGPAAPQTPESRLSRLPLPLTTFIGRGKELAEIKTLLPTTRLLTLTGAGGSGKTRMAIQVAADVESDFPDGIGWVDLARLIDPTLLPHTVAQAVGIHETAGRPLPDTIATYLHHRHFLLVLDNCEHLVDACADLVETLLRTCAQLKILATSRQVLDVAGETAWIVPSLAMPSKGPQVPSQIEQYEAVQLFVERARAAQPGIKFTAEDWQAIGRICRRLDGIPLAIELAASRMRILSIGEIESHLDERFQFLVGGNRTALPRHRTLRATMDWSYGLLSDPEKTLLRRLAVFSGGFTLESAARVCGQSPLDPHDVLTPLSNLVDKSLVLVEAQAGTSRYRLLETIRQYALERSLEARETELFYKQHLDYMLELATLAAPKLVGAEQKVWLQQLEAEQDNFRTALHRALENQVWWENGLRLAGLLWRYWWYRSELSEGRSWLERILAARPVPQDKQGLRLRLVALNRLGNLSMVQFDLRTARALLEESVQISQTLQDNASCAYALAWLSMTVDDQGESDLAQKRAEESIYLFRQEDDPWGLAYALFVRGKVALGLGNVQDARSFYEASVDLFRKLGDRWGLALPLGHLGVMAYRQGDYATGQRLLAERLSIAREFQSRQLISFALGHLARVCLLTREEGQAKQLLGEGLQLSMEIGSKGMIAGFLEGFAELAEFQGQAKRAVQLFAAADTLRNALAMPRDSQEQREFEIRLKGIKSGMNEKDLGQAWAVGQAMPLEEILQYALNSA